MAEESVAQLPKTSRRTFRLVRSRGTELSECLKKNTPCLAHACFL